MRWEHAAALQARLLESLDALGGELNAREAPRVPGIMSLRFPGRIGETLLMKLDLEGVAVSLASACSSGS